jgi:electron transport complex protein RnfC
LRNLIRKAGIVGLGGAGFPTYIKMNPGPGNRVETLILNGAECEPYITCDDRLMREKPEDIIAGLKIIRHAVQAKHCVIAIEDNKPQAIAAMQKALAAAQIENAEVVAIPTRYPAGGEKQLIYTITGQEVPAHGLPIQIGVVCQNVASCAAVHYAVDQGIPLISRYITVAGDVAQPRNLEVLNGTPVKDMIDFCGGSSAEIKRIIMGGPMMGFAIHNDDVPAIKTTNCIIIDAEQTAALQQDEHTMPCIRCGSCMDACPVNLLPQTMYWHSKAEEFDKVQEYNIFDCIECGCCDYVCPSHIPLVQVYRYAKGEIWKREREKQKAEVARERHEFRQERIDREKAERAAKRLKKAAIDAAKKEAAAAKAKAAEGDAGAVEEKKADPKQAAILAALERAKAKKEQQNYAPKNTENLTADQQKAINEANERRAQVEQASTTKTTSETDKE